MHLTSPETLVAVIRLGGHSYRDVAEAAGCSWSFIGHLAAGRKTSCTEQLAERIAGAAGVPLGVLFVDEAPSDRGHTAPRMKEAS